MTNAPEPGADAIENAAKLAHASAELAEAAVQPVTFGQLGTGIAGERCCGWGPAA
jgi:hypothetical protein